MNAIFKLTESEMSICAADFVELELGRHHLAKNWKALKDREQRVKAWATETGRECDPAGVVKIIDDWVAAGSKWFR